VPLLVYENGNVRKAGIIDMLEAAKALLLLIPIGKVTSYKELALALGVNPRLVGKLMKMNDEAPIIPCHRVVRSNGEIGGYSAVGGVDFKRKLLELEGVKFKNKRKINRNSFISLRELTIN